MRISEYFNLNRNQPYLDFVDIRLDTDIEVFVNPGSIKSLQSQWGQICTSLLQDFFDTIIKHIKSDNNSVAQKLLASLNERNEFHLGFSSGKSCGHGFGTGSAESVWKALVKSRASRSGLLRDLEDTCLLIEGIGRDMISDAVCNIIRGPLLKYTQDMCKYYGIPMVPQVDSGPIWDPNKKGWDHALIPLPVTQSFGTVVLIPKNIVRCKVSYNYTEYYRYYLLPEMQREELNANSSLVEVLKGKRRVTKKALMEKYGANKLAVVEQTIKRPYILSQYKSEKDAQYLPPLTYEQFPNISDLELPNWEDLLNKIKDLPTGQSSANDYEKLIEKLLSALFYPSLCYPTKQNKIHEGRKRIDITYINEAKKGFFYWLSIHYPCSHFFIECKNYGSEVGNPEIDQLSGRFSPSRGRIGILLCRKILDKPLLQKRCIDTTKDDRGFIIPLDDDDLEKIIKNRIKYSDSHEFPVLRTLFNKLIN